MTVSASPSALRTKYLDVIARALDGIAAADPTRPIVLGPGRTVADVVSWSAAFATAATEQLRSTALTPRPPVASQQSLSLAGQELLAVLSATPSRRPCWTPSAAVPPQAGFWLRRSAHALSVRAWQVQVAQDEPAALAPWLQLDGIDEHLRVMLAVASVDPDSAAGRARGTVSVRCTDVDAHWTLRLEPGCVPEPIDAVLVADAMLATDAILATDVATLRLGLAGMVVLPAGTGDASLIAALRLR